jgi:hypothetical protein
LAHRRRFNIIATYISFHLDNIVVGSLAISAWEESVEATETKKKKKKKVDQKWCAHLSESTLTSILVFNVVDGDDGFGVDGGDGVVAG